jgi:energy-coupling factor transporter ATP-binding protein EcfA2
MALLNDILKWTETLSEWQRDGARRLLLNERNLSDTDFSELYTLLKKGNGIAVDSELAAIPLAAQHLPAETVAGENVVLLSLRELENVNRIPNSHILKFSEKGMTVIYGGNGSGKSGYARVMKRACRARDQSEPIHPNALDPTAVGKVPSAKFDLKVAGGSEAVIWSQDSASPDRLSKISVFDSRCARSYVTAEKDVAYLPYGLDIVENLADRVLPKLTEMLDAELATIDVNKLPFEHLLGDTKVGKVIGALSENSNATAITALGTLSEADTYRLNDLERALKEADPLSKAKELRLSATRLKTYGDKLAKPLAWVSQEAVEKLKKLAEEKTSAELAETKAADALRAGEELLPGTGGQVWKLLFEAARRYSAEVAYPGKEFPPSADGKVCPLCQEDINSSGSERLMRFDEYIKNDVAKTANEVRKKVDTAKDKIERADLQIQPEEALRDELTALDVSIASAIEGYQTSLDQRRSTMLQCLETSKWEEIAVPVKSPRTRIRQLAAQQLKEFRTLVRAADEKKRQELATEHTELVARQNLEKSLKAILALVQRMKDKAALEKCRPGLRTRPISDKSKEFASIAVTEELKKSLDREFNALGIGHIQTKLKKRSVRGKMLHQLLLDLPTTTKIDEILSEGEQRAIALGSFLAELTLANHSCGIVFDDPVSSLDHKRRGKVARRLVQEAKNRQVIVFTHEVVFLQQLQDESKDEVMAIYSLEAAGGFAGKVSEGLPWIHKSFKERVSNLDANCRKFEKIPWPDDPSEDLVSEMIRQYSFIRATIERITQDLVLNGTVQRFRDYIEVSKLRKVVGLEDGEVTELLRLNQRCHDIVEAHDPSSAKDLPPPSASELRQDIEDLKALIKRINDRRAPPKPATSAT